MLTTQPWKPLPASLLGSGFTEAQQTPQTQSHGRCYFSVHFKQIKYFFKLFIFLTDVHKYFGYAALNSHSWRVHKSYII